VAPGDDWDYRVAVANSASGMSPYSNVARLTVPSIPAAPTGIAGTPQATASGAQVLVTWTDNAGNETGFTVQRATNSAFTANLVTFAAAANATSAVNPVAHGFTYYYRVQAVNVVGVSAWSNAVSATTVPATPTNLRATSITRTALTLNWNDVSANETGYQVQRKRAASNTWQTIRTTGPGATSYRVTGLSRNTSYDFRIRGVNGVGNSPWSASIRVRTLR